MLEATTIQNPGQRQLMHSVPVAFRQLAAIAIASIAIAIWVSAAERPDLVSQADLIIVGFDRADTNGYSR